MSAEFVDDRVKVNGRPMPSSRIIVPDTCVYVSLFFFVYVSLFFFVSVVCVCTGHVHRVRERRDRSLKRAHTFSLPLWVVLNRCLYVCVYFSIRTPRSSMPTSQRFGPCPTSKQTQRCTTQGAHSFSLHNPLPPPPSLPPQIFAFMKMDQEFEEAKAAQVGKERCREKKGE